MNSPYEEALFPAGSEQLVTIKRGKRADAEAIAALEREYETTFPADYRTFLQEIGELTIAKKSNPEVAFEVFGTTTLMMGTMELHGHVRNVIEEGASDLEEALQTIPILALTESFPDRDVKVMDRSGTLHWILFKEESISRMHETFDAMLRRYVSELLENP